MSVRKTARLLLCLVLLAYPSKALASDGEPRLFSGGPAAVAIGLEISKGDYGAGADATLMTIPLTVFLFPAEKLDIAIEVPFVYLSSKPDSGVVVTQSGGAGRGRAAGRSRVEGTAETTTQESGVGDINMTTGWSLLQEGETTPRVRPIFYLKVPSGDLDRGLGTGTVEAGPGLSLSKWLGNIQLFGEGAYIFQNSKTDYPGRNYASYLVGTGIQATDRWFLSVLAKGSTARAEGADAQAEGRLKLSFIHSRRLSWEIYGFTGFTDASPDIGGGMMVVYQF